MGIETRSIHVLPIRIAIYMHLGAFVLCCSLISQHIVANRNEEAAISAIEYDTGIWSGDMVTLEWYSGDTQTTTSKRKEKSVQREKCGEREKKREFANSHTVAHNIFNKSNREATLFCRSAELVCCCCVFCCCCCYFWSGYPVLTQL